MNKIQKISSYLLILFNILLITVPLRVAIEWLFICTRTAQLPSLINLLAIFERTIQTPEGYINLSTISWTPILKCLGFSADIIGLLPFLISLIILKSIFEHYKKGEVFNTQNARSYRTLGILFLINGLIIQSLRDSLLVLAVTLSNTPGHRYLTASFGLLNLKSLFYGTLVIIISWVMLEAGKMYEEQKLTI